MNFFETFKQSLEALTSNKLRSFLTMLGISIGIAAVIIIVAIGNGGQGLITGEFDKIGANMVVIQPKMKNITENEMITLDDYNAIKTAIPQLKNITPIIEKFGGKVRVGSSTNDASIASGNSQFKIIRGIEMVDGSFFTDYDDKSHNNVALISDFAAKKMFGTTKAVGKTFSYLVNDGNTRLTVIGIYKDLNPFAEMMGDQYPCVVLAPTSVVMSIYNTKYADSIVGSAIDKDSLEEIGLKMAKVLNYQHKTKDRYFAQNSASMLKSINKALSVVTIIIGSAAGISLLVGGIGIMNIMLMSVKERTREIGLRKALGARNIDIIVQFLTEAVLMTGFSGIIGIAIGSLIAFAVSKITKINLPVSFSVAAIAFVFSALFGIFFGVYPAKKAAELDPIEALRYE